MFFEQLKRICKMRGTTPTALVCRLGLSRSNVTYWKNGSNPKADVLQKLANELNVPVSAFFGELPEEQAPMPADVEELLEVYQQLGRSAKRQLLGKAYELLDAQSAQQTGDSIAPPDIGLAPTRLDAGVKK